MKRPSLLHAIAEPVRATGEFATSMALRPFRSRLPRGDGHPVLVLPGFTAGDRSTRPLRSLLKELGYDAYPWGLGLNMGPTERILDGLPELLEGISVRAGRTVSIIGWSLGGVYARKLATRRPRLTRSVITLGAPVRNEVRSASHASSLYEALSAFHVRGHGILDGGEPLDVPVTAIHTRTDGIVHWETCMVREAPNAENLRVRGSHIGLGHNPAVAYIVADRLAQPEGEFTPFEPPSAYRRIITREPGTSSVS